MKKILQIACITILCMLFFSLIASAHSGKTDSNGGHYDSSTGEYHYHHGYPAHQHYDIDGDGIIDCPYKFNDKTNHNGSNNKPSNNNSGSKNKLTVGIVFKIIGISLLALLLSSAFVIPLAYTLLNELISVLYKKLFKAELKDSTSSYISIGIVVIVVVAIVSISVLKSENVI